MPIAATDPTAMFGDMAQFSDEQLHQLALEGNETAFSFIYDRYGTRLLSYLYRLLGDPKEAQKAFDEVLLSIHDGENIYLSRSSFVTTLYATARNYKLSRRQKSFDRERRKAEREKRREELKKRIERGRQATGGSRRKGRAAEEEAEEPEAEEASDLPTALETDGQPMDERLWDATGRPARELRGHQEVRLFSIHEALPEGADSPEAMAQSANLVRFLQQSVAWLSEAHREALLLHLTEGLTYGQIAEVMELTPVAARDLVREALEELRQTFTTHA